ncbi:NAD(P)H-quinone oxidoreductase [Myxococcota bacterium]|nr:NAD(P)H-quinone oxidoreductase [Myxococcota bacterium]
MSSNTLSSNTMNAVVIDGYGDVDVLKIRKVPKPIPGRHEVLIRVMVAGVNRADILQRMGYYPAPPGVPKDIPGLEYAGVVESTGTHVGTWQQGDSVMGIVAGGAYADYIKVDERLVMRMPAGIDPLEAAAIPEAFLTAYDAIFKRLEMKIGENMLIHAVGSGVGTAAVQLAKVAGVYTLGTSRSAMKLAAAKDLGLNVGLKADTDWVNDAKAAVSGVGVDAIVDLVGGGYLTQNIEALDTCGRMVIVGLTGGADSRLDLAALLNKRATITGTTLRTRSNDEKAELTRDFVEHIVPLFERGQLQPISDQIFDMKDVGLAHQRMQKNANFGKILLRIKQ